jgi:hypothetical protein
VAKNDIEKVGLDQLAEEWLSTDELYLIAQIWEAPTGDKTLYVNTGQQRIIFHVLSGNVHFRVTGTLSRRRAITILLGLATVALPSLDHIVQFISSLLGRAIGP